jgi:cation-transporting ATPase E
MDNYAAKISSGAKYIKQTNSEILKGLRAVIRLMSIVVIPLGALLFLKQLVLRSTPLSEATVMMVSSMSSMIPQGLVALTSVVFAVGVIRLASHKTLAQDLYCIETLARVDVLCLDKTGTITEGSMQINNIVLKNGCESNDADNALISLISVLPDSNPTFNAIKNHYGRTIELSPNYIVPFSSERKWSGISIKDTGTFVMGAPEFVLREKVEEYREELNGYSSVGERVLVLAKSEEVINEKVLPGSLSVMAFVLIGDKIRKEAPDTLRFFAEQDVDIRIISGDNPVTVAAIARRAGLANSAFIDMSTVKTNEELIAASRTYKVFGRVSPEQKLKLVKALKADGHTVAMTGDGVNDVLALKEADCSIAVAEGSDTARSVAQLILLDSNFASMPKIVAEGRRSINNLQRSASLFLVKTIYSALLTMLFMFFGDYPFEPPI